MSSSGSSCLQTLVPRSHLPRCLPRRLRAGVCRALGQRPSSPLTSGEACDGDVVWWGQMRQSGQADVSSKCAHRTSFRKRWGTFRTRGEPQGLGTCLAPAAAVRAARRVGQRPLPGTSHQSLRSSVRFARDFQGRKQEALLQSKVNEALFVRLNWFCRLLGAFGGRSGGGEAPSN